MFLEIGECWTTIAKDKWRFESKVQKCENVWRILAEFFGSERYKSIPKVQKYANLVDLVKSFQTSISYTIVFFIYLQKVASIQPRTGLSKFAKN